MEEIHNTNATDVARHHQAFEHSPTPPVPTGGFQDDSVKKLAPAVASPIGYDLSTPSPWHHDASGRQEIATMASRSDAHPLQHQQLVSHQPTQQNQQHTPSNTPLQHHHQQQQQRPSFPFEGIEANNNNNNQNSSLTSLGRYNSSGSGEPWGKYNNSSSLNCSHHNNQYSSGGNNNATGGHPQHHRHHHQQQQVVGEHQQQPNHHRRYPSFDTGFYSSDASLQNLFDEDDQNGPLVLPMTIGDAGSGTPALSRISAAITRRRSSLSERRKSARASTTNAEQVVSFAPPQQPFSLGSSQSQSTISLYTQQQDTAAGSSTTHFHHHQQHQSSSFSHNPLHHQQQQPASTGNTPLLYPLLPSPTTPHFVGVTPQPLAVSFTGQSCGSQAAATATSKKKRQNSNQGVVDIPQLNATTGSSDQAALSSSCTLGAIGGSNHHNIGNTYGYTLQFPPPPPSMQTYFVQQESLRYGCMLYADNPHVQALSPDEIFIKPGTGDRASGYGPEYAATSEDGLPLEREYFDPKSETFARFYAVVMRWHSLASSAVEAAAVEGVIVPDDSNDNSNSALRPPSHHHGHSHGHGHATTDSNVSPQDNSMRVISPAQKAFFTIDESQQQPLTPPPHLLVDSMHEDEDDSDDLLLSSPPPSVPHPSDFGPDFVGWVGSINRWWSNEIQTRMAAVFRLKKRKRLASSANAIALEI